MTRDTEIILNNYKRKKLPLPSTWNYHLISMSTSTKLRSVSQTQPMSTNLIEFVWMGSPSFTPLWYHLFESVSKRERSQSISIRVLRRGTYTREDLREGVKRFDTMNPIGHSSNPY